MNDDRSLTRRRALGATALGAGVPILAACGGDEEPSGPASTPASDPPTSASTGAAGTTDAAEGLVATEDVPVGGGVILADDEVVVTQPEEGEFKAFSAVCTHAQCLVSSIDTTILCSCHGSRYALEDGAVEAGPAPSPLPAVGIAVSDGQVVRQ